MISVARGKSALLVERATLQRVSIADPEVAEALVVSPTEVLVNGRKVGTTSLLVWDATGVVRLYSVEVTADAEALQRHLRTLYPEEQITVSVSANTVTLSGTVTDASIARRAAEMARATGATVIDDISAPPAKQVLLRVRFAEVNRSAVEELSTRISTLNPDRVLGRDSDVTIETVSDGFFTLFLLNEDSEFDAVIQALKSRGLFKSLAEPNLLSLPGEEASFLAGGEFPFPVAQGGQLGAITIQWKEFGVRLNFTPVVTSSGNIRLRVAPEVSSLDFASGLSVSGFQIPAVLTRRAETEVELREGQHLAIAGLLDNSISDNIDKIPILGDLPILGSLFRSKSMRQSQTELLVLVTPQLVEPLETAPPVPTGEPERWKWDKSLRYPSDRPGVGPQ